MALTTRRAVSGLIEMRPIRYFGGGGGEERSKNRKKGRERKRRMKFERLKYGCDPLTH